MKRFEGKTRGEVFEDSLFEFVFVVLPICLIVAGCFVWAVSWVCGALS